MAAKAEPESGESRSGAQRLGLAIFAVLFAFLFGVLAIVNGLGSSSPQIPPGAVAIVEAAPEGTGVIAEADFQQALTQQAAFAGLEGPPKPGDEDYEVLREVALGELLTGVWLQGQAEAMGIELNAKRVEDELRRSGEEDSLREAHFTPATMMDRMRMQLLRDLIESQLRKQAPRPSLGELQMYYEENKDSRFTTPEKRDLRVIASEDPAQVEAAKRVLEAAHSPADWSRAAARYSIDPVTRNSGGLRSQVEERDLLPSLRSAVFAAPVGRLVGPLEVEGYYFAIKVAAAEPAKTRPFTEARAAIRATLASQRQQEVFSAWDTDFYGDWRLRTHCAEGFIVSDCANFPAFGHPASAAPCYEEDPAEPPPACPAVVPQSQPALPGSVTELNPRGEALPQGPLPEYVEEGGAGTPDFSKSMVEALPPAGL